MACTPADLPARLLRLLVPASVWWAERALLQGEVTEEHLRELLEFHQRTVEPLSRIFAFSLPCARALEAVARHCGPEGLVEIGAGTGLWAALLRRRGLTVHAYDNCESASRFGQVSFGGPECVSRHHGASLLLCWPPLEDVDGGTNGRIHKGTNGGMNRVTKGGTNTMAVTALRMHTGPGALFYIGEWRGATGLLSQLCDRTKGAGMIGGPRFQAEVEREHEWVETIPVPQWPGMADCFYVFRRREPSRSVPSGVHPGSAGPCAPSDVCASSEAPFGPSGILPGSVVPCSPSGICPASAVRATVPASAAPRPCRRLGSESAGVGGPSGGLLGAAKADISRPFSYAAAAPPWDDDGAAGCSRLPYPSPVESSRRGARLRLLEQVHAPGREWAWMAANVAWEQECRALAL
jgi:hypothetical protein